MKDKYNRYSKEEMKKLFGGIGLKDNPRVILPAREPTQRQARTAKQLELEIKHFLTLKQQTQ